MKHETIDYIATGGFEGVHIRVPVKTDLNTKFRSLDVDTGEMI